MPIVDVSWVATALPDGVVRDLADTFGRVFQSPAGGTWVRLRLLDPAGYAENDTTAPAPVFAPVFVTVLARVTTIADPAATAHALAAATARCLGVDERHVHVIYEPPADGRVYFGGASDPRA